MKNLYDPALVAEVKQRIATLRPDSPRQWGTMTPAQALAHMAHGMELPLGDRRPPRMMFGRIFGRVIKPLALGNDAPMRKKSPTTPDMIVRDQRDFAAERTRLVGLIDRFVAAGPAGCTTHPHAFFGPMVPREWAVLMYKHLDHHLRQFGV